MSDMTASAASQMESMSTRAATTGVKHGVRASVALSSGGTRVSAHVANRTAGGTIRALVAIIEAARFAGSKNGESGRVGLKQFTKITNGKREILPISEKKVAREFIRELRKHGVTFAIDVHRDGSRTFHVEGKDVAVVEHALSQASARVDEQIQREAERRAERDQDQPEQAQPVQTEGDDLAEETVAETVENATEPDDLSLSEQGARDLPDTDDLPTPEVVLQLDRREQAALVQALHGAPHREALAERIQSEAQVALNRENVATLNTVAAEQGWTTDGEMGWVTRTVEHEHSRLSPTTANPWLNVEADRSYEPVERSAPSEADLYGSDLVALREGPDERIHLNYEVVPGKVEELTYQLQDEVRRVAPDAPIKVNGYPHAPDGRGYVVVSEHGGQATAEQLDHVRTAADRTLGYRYGDKPEVEFRNATGERQLSPRDATREKVAKQIDTKAQAIKAERGVGQTKNRATPRSPKVKR